MTCVHNSRQFVWTLLYNKCLESIKALACQAPVLKPIDMNNPNLIWVICNSSKSGVSAIYRQGPEWQTCRPTGFLSKKFSSAQQNYRTHEHETIAILKALINWEHKLLGQKFVIVTNHKGLKYFETQPSLSSRQTRWWEYLSHFNFTIQHVDGDMNHVADCLSRYYENDGPDDHHLDHDFVSADTKLNPDGELIPVQRYAEIHTTATRRSTRLPEKAEQQVLDSDQMNNQVDDTVTNLDSDDDPPPHSCLGRMGSLYA